MLLSLTKVLVGILLSFAVTACTRPDPVEDLEEGEATSGGIEVTATGEQPVPEQQKQAGSGEKAKRLDLTVAPRPGMKADENLNYDIPRVLPELFGTKEAKDREKREKEKKASEKRTSVKVDLIRDENNPDVVQSVQGGTVSLEIKLPQSKSASRPSKQEPTEANTAAPQ